jgi:hypothetical protein
MRNLKIVNIAAVEIMHVIHIFLMNGGTYAPFSSSCAGPGWLNELGSWIT